MNHVDAWNELTERLAKAKTELKQMADNPSISEEEKARLTAKISGLRIAISYMQELAAVID